jgi:hypothetical protein
MKTLAQVIEDDSIRISDRLMNDGLYPSHVKLAMQAAIQALQESINETDDGK